MARAWRTVVVAALVALVGGCAGADAAVVVQPREDEVCAVAGQDGRATVTVGDARVGDQPIQLLRADPVNGTNLEVVGAAVVVGDREVPEGFDTARMDAGAEGTLVVTLELYADRAPAGDGGTATGIAVTLGGSVDGDLHVVTSGPRIRVVPDGGSCDSGS